MAVTRLGKGAGNRTTGSATNLSTSWTSYNISSSDANTAALVLINLSVSTDSADTTATVTYGGTTMGSAGLVLIGSTTNRAAAGIYYLFNPPTGAQTVTVTSGGASTKVAAAGIDIAFSGVGSVGAIQATAATTHAVASMTNGYAVRVLSNGADLSSPNQTSEYLAGSAVGGVGDFLSVQSAVGATSVSFTCAGTATTPESVGLSLYPPLGVLENIGVAAGVQPAGTVSCWVTLIGGGGKGGIGSANVFGSGGGGGGGGGRIDRVNIAAASLGTTYSVIRGAGGTSGGGAASVFATGSITLTANGGGVGGNASGSTNGTAGSGGTASAAGISATTWTGSNGGAGQVAGTDIATGAGAGGGGGGRAAGAGSKGGNSATVTGGAGGPKGQAGTTPSDATAGNGGAGGGGGGCAESSSVNGYPGGDGGLYGGGGGGGGGCGNNYTPGAGGNGKDGYTLVEWVYGATSAFAGHGSLSAAAQQFQITRAAAPAGHGVLASVANHLLVVARTGTGTLSATIKPALSRTLTGLGHLTATARMSKIAAPAPRFGHGMLTATTKQKFKATPALSGHGTQAPSARMYRIAKAAGLPGHGGLIVTRYQRFARSVSRTGSGKLTAAAYLYRIAATTPLTGDGGLAADLQVQNVFYRSVAREGAGVLEATASAKFFPSSPQYGLGALAASGSARFVQNTPVGGIGTLAPAVMARRFRDLSLAGAGDLVVEAHSDRFTFPTSTDGAGVLNVTTATVAPVAAEGAGDLSALALLYRIEEDASFAGAGGLSAAARLIVSAVETTATYDLRGAEVTIELVSAPTGPAKADFYLGAEDTRLELSITWSDGTLVALNNGRPLGSAPYDPVAHRYQRMREANGTLYFETSADAQSWDLLALLVAPYWLNSVYVGLRLSCVPGQQVGEVIYDNLNVPPARAYSSGTGVLTATIVPTLVGSVTGTGSLSGVLRFWAISGPALDGHGRLRGHVGIITPQAQFFPFFAPALR